MFTKDLFNELKQFVDMHLIVVSESIQFTEASHDEKCLELIAEYPAIVLNDDLDSKKDEPHKYESKSYNVAADEPDLIENSYFESLPIENQCCPSNTILNHENHRFKKDTTPVFEHELSDFVKNTKRPAFSELLLRYIDKLGISDTDVYKRAGIDRRHFSKIRSNPEYHPGKNTAIALALALSLERAEIDTLIGAAGYTLSDSDKFDLVITFCVNKRIYALDDVNAALDYFSLKPLAGVS